MKMECDVIRDLLPLYAENMVSAKSRELVNAHLAECEQCRQALSKMREPDIHIEQTIDPLQEFQKRFRKHNITIAVLSVFATIAAIIVIWGIFFLQPGDEMGYSLLCFYFLLPLTAFVCSWILGTRQTTIKWFSPLLFGAAGYVLPLAVFHASDALGFFMAFIPSLLGLLIGTVICAIRARTAKKL